MSQPKNRHGFRRNMELHDSKLARPVNGHGRLVKVADVEVGDKVVTFRRTSPPGTYQSYTLPRQFYDELILWVQLSLKTDLDLAETKNEMALRVLDRAGVGEGACLLGRLRTLPAKVVK